MHDGRSVSILIAALGGEGGGVLSEWVAQAASRADLPVQSTSIPGVAQRTGATTYYVEIFPEPHAALGGRRPILGLYPSPGAVDLVVASELIEAGRTIENGYVSPERTTLVAATHRVYAVSEKAAMAEGRFDAERVLRAAKEMAARPILFDPGSDPELKALPLNAVLLGAIAASGVVPVPEENFRQAIHDSGIAVEANLRGFDYGVQLGSGTAPAQPERQPPQAPAPDGPPANLERLIAQAARIFPADCLRTVELGLERCQDYQDADYAALYLERLEAILALESGGAKTEPHPLTEEGARQLALWMTYEDIIRVADLKTRPERFRTVRQELRANPHQPVRVRDYFKPGIDEIAAVLPPRLGRRLAGWNERRHPARRWHVPLHLQSSGIIGFTMMWSLARLRRLRRSGWRFAEEQAAIEDWLQAIRSAAPRSHAFAAEIARLPALLKGYSETHRRGLANYKLIMDRLVRPHLAGPASDLDGAAHQLARARQAALADPEGEELHRVLTESAVARYDLAAE